MADDLDFDAVEKLLDSAEKSVGLDPRDEPRKKDRRRSRSRSRSRRRRRSEEADSYERQKYREDREKEEERQREEQRRREEEDERKRQIEDATRGDRTVMVVSLNIKADERDVYEFFSTNAGKVRDVQIIRDARTGRSKGVAYIEFYLQESMLKALALSGHPVKGQAVRVQPSQAERNRMTRASTPLNLMSTPGEPPLRLYVGGLTDSLAAISEEALRKLFAPFGEIEFVDLHRDPYTNKCKGFAFVQFKKASEAREAMTAMNGFNLAGKELKVGIATADMQMDGGGGGGPTPLALGGGAPDGMDGEDGQISSTQERVALMQKLGGGVMGGGMAAPISLGPGAGGGWPQPMAPGAVGGGAGASTFITLQGMFDASKVNLASDPEFYSDIEADVEQECRKYGVVSKVLVEKGSPTGNVHVKFADVASAANCRNALDRRWFAGAQIVATFITEAGWMDATVKCS